MSKVIYGVFAQAATASSVAEDLNQQPGGRIYAIAHTHGVREEEVQYPGTMALRSGIVTGLVVGGIAAFMIWAVLWPMLGMRLGLDALGLLALLGSVFGVVAGAVAGASECKPTLAGEAERAHAQGSTVVTCETPDGDVEQVEALMHERGAQRVDAA